MRPMSGPKDTGVRAWSLAARIPDMIGNIPLYAINIGAGTAQPPTTTTTGTMPFTQAAAYVGRTHPNRVTTTNMAHTQWARWSATMAQPTRLALRPAHSGSVVATWTAAQARRQPTANVSSGLLHLQT